MAAVTDDNRSHGDVWLMERETIRAVSDRTGQLWRTELLYPIGTQSFEEIRSSGSVYVDMTALIYRLTSAEEKNFRGARAGTFRLTTFRRSSFLPGVNEIEESPRSRTGPTT